MQIVASLESLPGLGKSYLLHLLHHKYGGAFVETRPEPIHEWTNDEGTGVLDHFYKDPSCLIRFCELQTAVFNSLFKRDWKPITNRITVVERALGHSAYNVFMRMRKFNHWQHKRLFDLYRRNITGQRIDLIIYLRAPSVAFCMDKIKQRGRPCEQEITSDYVQRCHDVHDEWLLKDEREFWTNGYRVPVFVVDMEKIPSMDRLASDIATALDQFPHRTHVLSKCQNYISICETHVPIC